MGAFALAEGVVRKLNAGSPTLDNLELREFNPPEIKLLDKLEFVNLIPMMVFVIFLRYIMVMVV